MVLGQWVAIPAVRTQPLMNASGAAVLFNCTTIRRNTALLQAQSSLETSLHCSTLGLCLYCDFYFSPLDTENAFQTKLSHGQKQNTSEKCCLQYSFTFSHLQLHRGNDTGSDSAALPHLLNPGMEGEAVANRLFLMSFRS